MKFILKYIYLWLILYYSKKRLRIINCFFIRRDIDKVKFEFWQEQYYLHKYRALKQLEFACLYKARTYGYDEEYTNKYQEKINETIKKFNLSARLH